MQQHKSSPDKRLFFLEWAYTYVLSLFDLLRDVAVSIKIEEVTNLFERKSVVEEELATHKNTLNAHRV